MNYVRKHWQGRHSFAKTVGLNVVLFNVTILLALNKFIAASRAHNYVPPTLIIILMLLICLVILLWQSVGAYRSASRSIARHGSSASYYCVFAVMLGSSLFILGNLVTLSVGFIDYRQEAVDAYKPPKRNFTLTIADTGSLIFSGDVDRGATDALRQHAKNLPKGAQLTLNSLGGLIVEARGMAKVVNEYGLHTHVVQRCYSACTLVFISGLERSLDVQGELGFHQYDVYSQTPLPWIKPAQEQQKDLKLFRDKQIAEWFLTQAYNTPHESIWIPVRHELISAGVIRDE